jgi:hypothetical protein
MYIVVSSANARSFYLARRLIGGTEYVVIATFNSLATAKDIAAQLNKKGEQR